MKSRIYLTTILVLLLCASCDLYEDIFDNNEDKTGSVTDVDGNVYPTVTIGNQVWMAENLKTTKFCDSTVIYTTTCPTIWANLTKGACCWYNNDGKNKTTYGVLYNWYAVKTGKLCPKGWHVPTREEWTKLEFHLGGSSVAGSKMKSVTGWTSTSADVTNSSGFSGLPGGARKSNGNFESAGGCGNWWSSAEDQAGNAWGSYCQSNSSFLTTSSFNKASGFSIRCIKD